MDSGLAPSPPVFGFIEWNVAVTGRYIKDACNRAAIRRLIWRGPSSFLQFLVERAIVIVHRVADDEIMILVIVTRKNSTL